MREAIVVVFVVLYLALVAVLVQGCVDQSDDSSESAASQSQTNGSAYERYSNQSEDTQYDDPVREEPANQAEVAVQVLDDISEAEVDQRTQDLKAAFRHLGDICAKAVETRDALLSTPYTTNEEKQKVLEEESGHGI